jgi:hypothetical protein
MWALLCSVIMKMEKGKLLDGGAIFRSVDWKVTHAVDHLPWKTHYIKT